MLILITGGSGSGKSEYAESLLVRLAEEQKPHYYIAAMKPYGMEAEERIRRHRQQRAGRGFYTIEQYTDISQTPLPEDADVLVECLSNLTANEMFDGGNRTPEAVCEAVVEGILHLYRRCRHLVLVSNEIFSDGACYEESTKSYMRCLAAVNCTLAKQADIAADIVYSLPVFLRKNQDMSLGYSGNVLQDIEKMDTGRKGKAVDFIIGGYHQGKTDYVKEHYQIQDAEIISGSEIKDLSDLKGKKCLNGFHLLVRGMMEKKLSLETLVEQIFAMESLRVIISDEVGYGVVPVDRFERYYREQIGRQSCYAAERAERVVRVICGCGQVLKG